MRLIKTTYHLIATFVLLLAIVSCTDDALTEVDPTTPPTYPESSSAFITLSVNVPVQTRSGDSPQGGEDGDGKADDLAEENKVDNITVLFYQAAGKTLNEAVAAGVELDAVAHFVDFKTSDASTGIYVTTTTEVKLKSGIYRMLVIANALRISDGFVKGTPLRTVCESILKYEPWTTKTDGTASGFVMSSYEEKEIELTIDNSIDNPASVTDIQLQRLAARVDFVPAQGGGCIDINTYKIENFKIKVDRIKTINRMIAGTYLLKHTAVAMNDDPTLLGKETEVDKKATNYVIDPWTTHKTLADLVEYSSDDYYADRAADERTWSDADNIQVPASGLDYYRLAYVLENTTDKEAQLNGYSTGVIIEATATPEKVINDQGKEELYTAETDFFTYEEKVYKDAGAVTYATRIQLDDFSRKGVKEYVKGKMYYPYFIRHCYNGTTSNGIMEFGIVRNNIYKLKILSFSSLGNTDDTIDPRNPDKETMIKIGAAVRPWNRLDDENIVM